MEIVLFFVFIGFIFWLVTFLKKEEDKKIEKRGLENKKLMLMAKYNDEALVNDLMKRSFWVGQSLELLVDSLGEPHSVDIKVLKTKKKEVWKYNHRGANRYGLRITLEDNTVVGFDQKT